MFLALANAGNCPFPLQRLQPTQLKLMSKQLTIQILAQLFAVFPDIITPVSGDGYIDTTDEDGRFYEVNDLLTWAVAGDSTKPSAPQLAGTSRIHISRN